MDTKVELLDVSHYEHLLNEVEATEGQLGAILRTLYEGEEQEEFLGCLSSRIKNHERDIERMCNKNYQGFIESVSELHKVKSDALKLKRKIIEANSVIQDSGEKLVQSAIDLHRSRQIHVNLVATMDTLNRCTPVLQEYCKLNDQMEHKEYYSALKTLELLEHTYLPRVRGYIFSELLSTEIPKIRESIQGQSRAELTDFLANVREKSVVVGEVAMHQTQRHSNLELAQDVLQFLDPSSEPDPEVCAQDLIDFSPIYRCLHIHSVLGKRDLFTDDYRNQRKRQVRLAIKPHGNWKGGINDYKKFFYGIVGFFVVEDTVLHTSQSLVSQVSNSANEGMEEGLSTRKNVHDFWQMAMAEVLAVLRNNCGSCENYHILLKIKQLVVWFCHTLRGYGFEVDKLYEVLLEIREQYDELLMRAWGDSFTELFDSDDYTPIMVSTDEQFKGVLEIFPYKDTDLEASPFPKSFPFSSMVYQVFSQLKNFVTNCTSFANRLNLSQTEIDEIVRKSVNLLLGRTMTSCLFRLINTDSLLISQLVQIWINVSHIENSIKQLESFIAKTTKTEHEGVTAARLYGVATFKEGLQLTEQRISAKLMSKMSEILEGASTFDWMTKDEMSKPSEYLEDCLQFLQATFRTLRILPEKPYVAICLDALRALHKFMENILLSEENPKISAAAIQNFAVDIKRCDSFVNSTLAANQSIPQDEAKKIFLRTQLLVAVFVSNEWTLYINEYQLQQSTDRKYAAVPPQMVYTVLFKLKEAGDKKKKLFNIKSSSKKEQQKYYEMVLRKLQDYIALETDKGIGDEQMINS
ncbi:exocyst complex component 6B-like isoform X2 [Halichondria panicea]|uniref:exocyst complex component 6B-like isoform X2 n=1 Tax=Halichondria panicea TaxID=6063 RepID=UPI00312B611E